MNYPYVVLRIMPAVDQVREVPDLSTKPPSGGARLGPNGITRQDADA